MAFTTLFLAHAPDADAEKHVSVIDTGKYRIFTVVARDHREALEVCRRFVRDRGVHSILLCPGHTHRDVADIAEAVGPNVSISVARGDGPGMRLAAAVMERESWFPGGRSS